MKIVVNQEALYIYSVIQVPFPSERYAEIAMRTIGVEPAFSDSKTRKTSIERAMHIDVLENNMAYSERFFPSCPEVQSLEETLVAYM